MPSKRSILRLARVVVMLVMIVAESATRPLSAQEAGKNKSTIPGEALEVGFASSNITPPIGMRLCGTFEEKLSTGVHDSLYVRAFIFQQSNVKFAVVGCDLAMMSPEVCDAVRDQVMSLGLPRENVLIHASETHNGPDYFGELREVFHQRALKKYGYDPAEPIDYPAFLTHQITEAIRAANRALRRSEIYFGQGKAEGIAFYRRYRMKDGSIGWNPGKLNPDVVKPAGPTDISVPVLTVGQPGEADPAALVVGFALHLATLEDQLYSADYPYYLYQKLKSVVSPNLFSHFLQAPCNEVNHIDVFTEKPQTGYPWAKVIVEKLAGSVGRVLRNKGMPLEAELKVGAVNVALSVQEFSEEETEKQRSVWYYADRSQRPFLEVVHAAKVTGISERHQHGTVSALVQAFQLSPETVIIGLPSEVSVELGLAIKQSSPYANTLLVQLSNDWFGYIPTQRIFEEGNYEAVVAKIRPGEGERLVKASLDLITDLKAR